MYVFDFIWKCKLIVIVIDINNDIIVWKCLLVFGSFKLVVFCRVLELVVV